MTGFDYELPPETVALQCQDDGSDAESVVSVATADSSVWTQTRKASQSTEEETSTTATTSAEKSRKKKLSTAVVHIGMHDIIR